MGVNEPGKSRREQTATVKKFLRRKKRERENTPGQKTFGLVLAMFEVPSPEAYKHRLGVVTSYYAGAKLTVSLDR